MNAMTNEEFKAWRSFMGWSQRAAGRVLDISAEAVKSYERGTWSDGKPAVVPGTISRLCRHERRIKEDHDEAARVARGE